MPEGALRLRSVLETSKRPPAAMDSHFFTEDDVPQYPLVRGFCRAPLIKHLLTTAVNERRPGPSSRMLLGVSVRCHDRLPRASERTLHPAAVLASILPRRITRDYATAPKWRGESLV